MKHLCFAVVIISLSLMAAANPLLCPELPSGAQIRPENRYFEVLPRIVPANRESVIEIVPLFDHARPSENCAYELTYAPMEYPKQQDGWEPGKKMAIVPENGRFRITTFFESEQEHTFIIESTCDDKKKTVGNFRVYSVEEDLYKLRPYKGDFHMHSHRSDGIESPAYVAGACRRAGLHFMALSDHRWHDGSMEAHRAYADAPIDLRIYPGEEVHTPDNPIHILSFGANEGITELYRDDETQYRAEVAALMESLPPTPPGVNRFHYAACVWAVKQIRDRNGMAMLCHPYWITRNRHNVEEPLLNLFFEREVFDALELISGFGWESLHAMDVNALQVARYLEERAKGRRIAVCGISDTHGHERSDAFGRYFTVCFAPSPDLPDLIAAIKDLRSVAVESPAGTLPRAYGPFRLVKFTQYLLREVLPQHDELCFEEGRLMIQYAAGDTTAAQRLKQLQGQTARLYDRYWTPVAK
ncbi:MAG TPA: hypothetical protein ENN29_13850 [Candidatus Hydrogenedentes bacterium]|nr:hypothetical protein [Candidatus Hydrogenedentota bacterium]